MEPAIALDPRILAANARAWTRLAGRPVRAVVKADGYGFGATTLIDALDDVVAGYVVADAEELAAARPHTARPIAVLGAIAEADFAAVLDADGRPNVLSASDVARVAAWQRAVGRIACVRLGVRPALGWFGIRLDDAAPIAERLAACGCAVELWTHLTDPTLAQEQLVDLARLRAVCDRAGVRVRGVDVGSTRTALARDGDAHVRIGIGLFGARAGAEAPGLRCALDVRAPVVRCFPATGERIGYGSSRAPKEGFLAVLRIGYGDGFSRAAGGFADDPSIKILSVGMQYTVTHRAEPINEAESAVVGPRSDLDELARASGCTPHEFVVRLGTAGRTRASRCKRG